MIIMLMWSSVLWSSLLFTLQMVILFQWESFSRVLQIIYHPIIHGRFSFLSFFVFDTVCHGMSSHSFILSSPLVGTIVRNLSLEIVVLQPSLITEDFKKYSGSKLCVSKVGLSIISHIIVFKLVYICGEYSCRMWIFMVIFGIVQDKFVSGRTLTDFVYQMITISCDSMHVLLTQCI